MGRRK